ncbi:hypothetical protein J7F01_29640, partial [Streptomyces sp. ISL-22]|uniref:NHL repeat-containing protein n=1 Tax=unclassified Streptomyces TaxID=2593676 RepID=UPI001BECEAA1
MTDFMYDDMPTTFDMVTDRITEYKRQSAATKEGVLTTVTGTGVGGYNGDTDDGTPVFGAHLNSPDGLAADDAGNLYVVDTDNHRVRRVAADGTITTIAGTGTAGFSGDGGQAVEAQLSSPEGLILDRAGNLYIADDHNQRVRRVSADGVITTVAGTGEAGYGGDGAAATSAQLNNPFGLAMDRAGNLYITEHHGHRVRRMAPDGTITTFAGTGVAGYDADNKQASAAQLSNPCGLALDNAGSLYIADFYNNRVRRVAVNGTITTVAGTGVAGSIGDGGPATTAQLDHPCGLALDTAGNLYITEHRGHRVRRVAPDGTITTVAGTGAGGYDGDDKPAIAAQLRNPEALAIDRYGNLYIADNGNHRVRKVAGPKEAALTVVQTGMPEAKPG